MVATLLALSAPVTARAAIQTQHVVIVSIDGGRYSETLGHPNLAYHPRIGIDLAAVGARPTRFENIGVSNTNPGHSALVTGTLQPIANDGSERPHKPTLFEYLRQQKGTPQSQVRIVTRKAKLDVLTYSDHPSYGAPYGATFSTHGTDPAVYTAALSQILTHRPVVTFVHFGDPDFEGHANDWPGYLTALRLADSLTWQLWTAIQADPVMGGKTTIFVSNDHGRHLDAFGGFQNHGDSCDGCRRIMMMMAGPDSYAGFVSGSVHEQRAVARTAGYLLGITMPLADGRVMDDLLVEPSAPWLDVPRPVPTTGRIALTVHPNPTRAGASVSLSGAGAARARVELLDVSGRRIVSLTRGGGSAAGTTWSWDGRDASGRELAPGQYIVQARDGATTARTRIVKLR